MQRDLTQREKGILLGWDGSRRPFKVEFLDEMEGVCDRGKGEKKKKEIKQNIRRT